MKTLRLVSVIGEDGNYRHELTASREPWRGDSPPGGYEPSLGDPLDRSKASPVEIATIKAALDIARGPQPYKPWRGRPTHAGVAQAVANFSMAYTLGEGPTAEELWSFFPAVWPRDDIVMERYSERLTDVLRQTLSAAWLDAFVSPRLDYLNSHPLNDREMQILVGISRSGKVRSTGLRWIADEIIYYDHVWIPCVDVSGIFWSATAAPPPKREAPFRNSSWNAAIEMRRQAISLQATRGFPSFRDAVRDTLKEAINEVRVGVGLPRIGEGWFSETDLFYRIKTLFPNENVVQHGRPQWLGRQHFDVWIPGLNIAVEYHGEQHFKEVAFFGGEAGFRSTRERDERKRRRCSENGVRLFEIAFNDDLSDKWLADLLKGQ